MPGVRKIVLVNTSDAGGGAERISMDLLNGFGSLGVDAWLAVGDKRTNHPRVVSFYTSPHVDYRPKRRLDRVRLRTRRRVDKRIGLEDFNHPYTRHLVELTGSRPDVVLCNNLHGGYFDLRQLRHLSLRVPLVLRLADGWTLTGHCAVPGSCERWRTGCGHCPDLAAPPSIPRDATRVNWHRKRRIYSHSRIFVITPSRWMLDRARTSILAPAIRDARVIHNGVDLRTFSQDGSVARHPDPEVPRLVFAANGGAANPHKDFATIRSAVQKLEGPVELVSIGGAQKVEDLGRGVRIRHEPQLPADRLAALYRSAVAYVHASAEESFGLTSAEALACGTPVVAASGGGISEVVDHGVTGFVHAPGDADGMGASVRRLIADAELRQRMGASAAERASSFDRDRMVRDVQDFCAEAMEAWPR